MARAKHASLPYRPALDGLRAVAVAAVVIYHVNNGWAQGGWLGVDLFFVLSGFLITSLLLSEYHRWGSISLAGFWAARARRLLPSLVAMLLAVLAASFVWAEPGRRSAIAKDVLATLLYVANWRFLASDEQYFDTLGMGSPVRHAWSLAIEEQYYLIYPVLLIGVLTFARKRIQLAMLLLAGAAVSALWMAHLYVPDVDPSRVYYGTDTRIFELLIGAAAGALLGAHEFAGRSRWRIDRYVGVLAWPALATFVVAFFTVNEVDSWVFRGGLVLLCLIAVVPITAASARGTSSFQRALGWEPLRQLGLMSYSLYLWHWPVIVFLNPDRIGLTGIPLALAQIAVSIALAYLSLTYLEQPIRRHGFPALLPRHPRASAWSAGLAVPVLLAGIVLLPFARGGSAAASTGGDATLAQPAYDAPSSERRVTLLGNSIPASMVEGFSPAAFPGLQVTNATSFGCDPFEGVNPMESTQLAACAGFRKDWPGLLRRDGNPNLVVLYLPQTLVSGRTVDGRELRFGTSGFDAWLRRDLGRVRSTALATAPGARFAVVNVACHRQANFGQNPEAELINDDTRVQRVNAVAASWARSQHVPVIDQYAALCTGGYHSTINSTALYSDTLHFTPASAQLMWRWMAPQLLSAMKDS